MFVTDSFFSFDLGRLIEFGALIVAFLAYRADRKKDALRREEENREREEKHEKEYNKHHEEILVEQKRQDEMHKGNLARLDMMSKLIDKQSSQVNLLATQTATLSEMAKGLNRRLEMLEDDRTTKRTRKDDH